MTERHLTSKLFERFLSNQTSPAENQKIVRHLLEGCTRCSRLAVNQASELGLFPDASRAGAAAGYEAIFARSLAFASEEEQRLAVEKLRGWAQWAELEPLSPQRRFVCVQSAARFHRRGLYDRLLEAAKLQSRTDPADAVDIVRLAILVAEHLDPKEIGEKRRVDLEAGAWGALGNVMRIAEDFEGARRAYNEAWRILEQGSGDPAEEANLVSLEASYIKDIGEFETAESSLEEALQLYRQAHDPEQEGRIFLQMGEAIGHVNPERGLSHIARALPLLDSHREPRLRLCAEHARAWFLSDLGRTDEALAVLERARPLYRQFKDDLTQLRLHWLEGRIAYRIGDYAEAEKIFGQVWEEFRSRNLNQEVVLVSVELAEVLAKKGETARAAELAAECFAVMQGWGLHNFACAAWIVFQEALAEGALRGDLFREMERYFRRHWFIPAKFRG